jgi:hypothetical protein
MAILFNTISEETMPNFETENYQLTGQVAIITGGGRGIGRVIA